MALGTTRGFYAMFLCIIVFKIVTFYFIFYKYSLFIYYFYLFIIII